MPVHTAAIRAFLEKWETSRTDGYIPCRRRNFTGREERQSCGDVIGVSGVTIGTGLDLGQHSPAELARMGVPGVLTARFAPYCGKQGELAVAALSVLPLMITEEEREELDNLVLREYVRRAARLYDAASFACFDDLPAEAQTVIVSLLFHLGAGTTRYPRTWRLLCEEDWAGAARELKTGFTRFANRRTDEGRLLERLAARREAA